MSRRTLASFAAVVLAAGLGACAPERGPIGHLKVPGERGTEYRITPDSLSDAKISISRVDNTKTFRGLVTNNREIEVRIEGDMLNGQRSNQPIAIKVTQQGNEIVAKGLYGGQATAVHILHEPAGTCAFRYDEREHPGASTCAGQPSLWLPAFMGTWSMQEQALFMIVAFAEVYQGPQLVSR